VEQHDVLARLDGLQNRYVAALDGKDMPGWLATFSEREDASYICRSAENESMGLPIALMLDDCRARLKDRITFVTKIWTGTFQDYRTRHFTQRLFCERTADDTFRLRSNFSIEYTLDPNATAVLAAGIYEDVVVLEGDEARFLSKRAIYDTTVLAQYVIYLFHDRPMTLDGLQPSVARGLSPCTWSEMTFPRIVISLRVILLSWFRTQVCAQFCWNRSREHE
jgi:anthranilate 1,2-dioxygenase small subunit